MWAAFIKLLLVLVAWTAAHQAPRDLTQRIFPDANQSGQYVKAPECARLLPAGWCQ